MLGQGRSILWLICFATWQTLEHICTLDSSL